MRGKSLKPSPTKEINMSRIQIFVLLALMGVTAGASAGDNGGGTLKCQGHALKIDGGAGVAYKGRGPASFSFSLGTASVNLDPTKLIADNIQLVDFVNFDSVERGDGFLLTSYSVLIKRTAVGTDGSVGNEPVFSLRSVASTFRAVSGKPDVYSFSALIDIEDTINPAAPTNAAKFEYKMLGDDINIPNNSEEKVSCILDLSV
jgi:hypothetical protein